MAKNEKKLTPEECIEALANELDVKYHAFVLDNLKDDPSRLNDIYQNNIVIKFDEKGIPQYQLEPTNKGKEICSTPPMDAFCSKYKLYDYYGELLTKTSINCGKLPKKFSAPKDRRDFWCYQEPTVLGDEGDFFVQLIDSVGEMLGDVKKPNSIDLQVSYDREKKKVMATGSYRQIDQTSVKINCRPSCPGLDIKTNGDLVGEFSAEFTPKEDSSRYVLIATGINLKNRMAYSYAREVAIDISELQNEVTIKSLKRLSYFKGNAYLVCSFKVVYNSTEQSLTETEIRDLDLHLEEAKGFTENKTNKRHCTVSRDELRCAYKLNGFGAPYMFDRINFTYSKGADERETLSDSCGEPTDTKKVLVLTSNDSNDDLSVRYAVNGTNIPSISFKPHDDYLKMKKDKEKEEKKKKELAKLPAWQRELPEEWRDNLPMIKITVIEEHGEEALEAEAELAVDELNSSINEYNKGKKQDKNFVNKIQKARDKIARKLASSANEQNICRAEIIRKKDGKKEVVPRREWSEVFELKIEEPKGAMDICDHIDNGLQCEKESFPDDFRIDYRLVTKSGHEVDNGTCDFNTISPASIDKLLDGLAAIDRDRPPRAPPNIIPRPSLPTLMMGSWQ